MSREPETRAGESPTDSDTTHSSSFNIRTARDFLHELILPQYEEFVRRNASSRHALLSFVLIYHMYEWVHLAPFTRKHFQSTYPDQHDVANLLELAKGIANGTKHFKPKRMGQVRPITRVQGGFSSAFSDGFARPLNVELPDGTSTSVDNLLGNLVDFWKRQERLGAF